MNRLTPAVLGLVVANAIAFIVGLVQPHASDWLLEQGAFWCSAAASLTSLTSVAR